ncbi:hypothetical protein AN477_07350 [Alicyclobacillus ferrooxydans]|uniref:alpha-galactosidase n=1 Tax=Alicyclobacillus ferrooxydans TaxID=471514 RepID=A0A0P9CFB9_9BACL|nr:hypothetical protein AN477_07350 [Alicyclobacillus ferrooxydans]
MAVANGSPMSTGSASQLVHLYWGPTLPRDEDYIQHITFPERSSFDYAPLIWPHEYRPWHGRMYQEPSLRVTFSDGTRDVAWKFERAEVAAMKDTHRLTLCFSDPKGLDIKLHYETRDEQDVIARWVEVTNVSQDIVQVTHLSSAVWSLPILPAYRTTTVYGDWGREFQLQRSFLSYGKQVIESRKGHTSHQTNPLFMLDSGNANEESGDVWFGALAWSGNWKIAFERNTHNQLSVSGGLNDFDFVSVLGPREKVASPHFYAGYTNDGFGGASREMHRLAHRIQEEFGTKERPTPVLYNSWEATYFDVNEPDQMKLAEIAADLGVELFVVDDGWFGRRNSDTAGLGDWTVNPEKFPDGLDPLIRHVQGLGMKFGIWVEPEMVNPDSDLYRAHPDWVLHFPDRDRTLARHQAVLDYSNQAVRDHIFGLLDELLSRHSIAFVKWDMNRPLTEPGSATLAPDMQPEVWTRHVEGLYEILGRLHTRHPNVVFESCSGGGGRVDLAMLQFASQFWTSDNTDAYDRLRIQEGFSYAYPASTMRAWVTDSPQFMNHRKVPLVFRFHSAMMGALGIGADISQWTTEEREEAAKRVELYKTIRHLVTDGELYRLLSPTFGTVSGADTGGIGAGYGGGYGVASGDAGAWSAVEYADQKGTEAVVFVLGRGTQYGDPTPVIRPVGLDDNMVYTLEVLDVHTADEQRFYGMWDLAPRSGLAWARMGFRLLLRGDYASAIIRFKAVVE